MRISTNQVHQQSLSAMLNQQAKLQQTQMQVSSGLRIMKPSDDPVGAVKVLNLTNNMSLVDQYGRNVAQAQSSLGYEESVLNSVNDSLQQIRVLTVQANNPANQGTAKTSIALELDQQLKALKELANSRDANGDYIFSGNRADAPPFVDNGSTVTYQGDQGQRQLLIGEGTLVAVRDSGDSVFMNIPNGDGRVSVSPAPDNAGSVVVGQYSFSGKNVPPPHTLTFSQPSAGQPLVFTVTDSAVPPNVVATGNYTDGNSISAAGVQFTLTGTPAAGDSINIGRAQNTDIFSTVAAISAALKDPATGTTATANLQNALNQGLGNLDQALDNLQNHRAAIGARLSNIDNVDSMNQDFKLQLDTVLSSTQDLDYAEAITRFNLQLTSLQAAQQAYMKTSDLGLFNYM